MDDYAIAREQVSQAIKANREAAMNESTRVESPPWDDADPYTMARVLCNDEGMATGGAMHHGTDYLCTGHAHFAGEHIRCMSSAHDGGPPNGVWTAFIAGLHGEGRVLGQISAETYESHLRSPGVQAALAKANAFRDARTHLGGQNDE